jgi:hypothetical protein
MKRLLVLLVAALVLAGGGAALASMTANTTDPTVTVAKKGRQVGVTVLLGCDRVQSTRLRVTVTQREGGGAVAQGRKNVRCTTDVGRFALQTKARGKRRFEPGNATACALAVTNDDARQWCKDVTLVAAASKKK